MIDFYENVRVAVGTKIRVHPENGEPFVAEAVQAPENSCEGCILFEKDIDCLGLHCANGNIFRKVEEDEAKEEEVG